MTQHIPWVMALCLGLQLMSASPASAALVQDPSNIRTKPMRTVCLVYYEPMVLCDMDKDPSTYAGHDVQLFRLAAEKLAHKGYTEWEPENYNLLCTDWDTMMAEMLMPAETRKCDVSVAGMDATTERMGAGFKFTHPTYKSGRHIMISADTKTSIFGFLEPFDTTVWLMVFATTVVVGIAVLLAEVPVYRLFRQPGPAMEKYFNLQWASTAMLLQAVQQFSVKSVGGRVIILGYAFLVLIIVNMYIAVLSSQLTVTSINLSIKGLSDLANKPVGIFEADMQNMERFNLNLHPLSWNNAEDEAAMLHKLRSQELSALIMDAPFVEYTASQSCDLHLVGDWLLPVSLAYAFPPDVSLEYIDLFNEAIIALEEEGKKEELRQQWVAPSGGCSETSTDLSNQQISLHKVAGLWVFLGAAMGLGFFINSTSYFIKIWKGEDEDAVKPKSGPGSASIKSNKVAASGDSSNQLQGRSQSFFQSNPDLSWVNVGDASTTEEALEVLEGHVRTIDARIKNMGNIMDQRFAALNETLAAMHPSNKSFTTQGSHSLVGTSGYLSLHKAPSAKPSLFAKALSKSNLWPRSDSAAEAIPHQATSAPNTPKKTQGPVSALATANAAGHLKTTPSLPQLPSASADTVLTLADV